MKDNNKKNIRTQALLYFSIFQALIILILLYIAFGFVVTYFVVFTIMLVALLLTSYIAIHQTRNIRTAEKAFQYVFDNINDFASEIDQEIKEMVWAEDSPQVRKVVSLVQRARQELLNIPLYYNGAVIEDVYGDKEDEEKENN